MSRRASRGASRRASPGDWCSAGLALLRDEGIGAVTVDRLCAAVRRTKGSFYHHFRDLDGFQAALLARWEEELTEAPIRAAGGEADPARRGARLASMVSGLDHQLDREVRAWGRRDGRARDAMERIDRRRIDHLAELHLSAGCRQPRLMAELEYAAFVGVQHLGWFASPPRAARLRQAQHRALSLLASAAPP